jgi:23S rRNA (guanosine2251-2'-O)-methyltransferase
MKKSPASDKEIWISGINPVREALKAVLSPSAELILARSDPRGRELEEMAHSRGVRIGRDTRERLTELAGHVHHQGVALKIPEFPYAGLEDLLEKPLPERDPLVILDSIQDPQNLGAILRSACFLGAGGVVIPRDRAARVTASVIKIAAGATSYLPVAQITNLARALGQMKEAGFWIAGLDVMGDKTLFEADLTVPLCLVVGNEQKGIRPLVRSECDLLVRIPALGPIESLNVASATTVALAEIQRQRLSSAK